MLSEKTNSEFGSKHWYMSLISEIIMIADKLINSPSSTKEQKDLGHKLYFNVEELQRHFSDINKT